MNIRKPIGKPEWKLYSYGNSLMIVIYIQYIHLHNGDYQP